MIGLFVLVGGLVYVLLARIITKLIFKKTEQELYKRLAIAFFILVPTWDVIIGYPIYWYLCKFHSGVEIYETVNGVEGFYIGEQHKLLQPIMPPDGYQYVDYTLKYSNGFLRSRWLNSADPSCYQSTTKFSTQAYEKKIQSGRCVSVAPISEKNMSRYEVITSDNRSRVVPLLKIEKIVSPMINDRQSNKILAKVVLFRWNQGWIKESLTIGGGSWVYSQNIDSPNMLIHKILKGNR